MATHWWEPVSALATSAGAVATSIALIVTIYVSILRPYWRQPRLSLAHDAYSQSIRSPMPDDTGFVDPEEAEYGVASLSVTNARHKTTAHDVEVLLSWRVDEDSESIYQSLIWWSSESDIRKNGGTTTRSLGAGVTRRISFAVVGAPEVLFNRLGKRRWSELDEGEREEWDDQLGVLATFPLDVESNTPLWSEDPLEVTFVISARDIDSVRYRTTLKMSRTSGSAVLTVGALTRVKD